MTMHEKEWQTPEVVFQPSYQGVQEGIHTFVNAIRPTLGPIHRMVAIEKPFKVERPEPAR